MGRSSGLRSVCCALLGCGGGAGYSDAPDAMTFPDALVVDATSGDTDGEGIDGGDEAGPDGVLPWLECARDQCDPTDETACAEGEACVLSGPAPSCSTGSRGKLEAGESCSGSFDCREGLACFLGRDGSRCRELCCRANADDGCPNPDELCVGSSILADGTRTDWSHCRSQRPCDPLLPAAVCDGGEGCYIVAVDAATDCRHEGAATVGERCMEPNDCAAGFFCAGTVERTCVRVCDRAALDGDRACPESEGICQQYPYTPEGLGLCTQIDAI